VNPTVWIGHGFGSKTGCHATSLEGSKKTHFRSFIYSRSSTKRENLAKIDPVDVEIIGLREIAKVNKDETEAEQAQCHNMYLFSPSLDVAMATNFIGFIRTTDRVSVTFDRWRMSNSHRPSDTRQSCLCRVWSAGVK